MRFNSSASWTPYNDSIIERKWNFGDGTPIVVGNDIAPIHSFAFNGVYNVCLRIVTAKGCTNEICQPVRVGDSTIVVDSTEPIKLISLLPNPATTQFSTVVWSKYNNVRAEYAIVDIYGVKKWSTTKLLYQGNTITTIPCYYLLPGPYFLRVTTIYGIKSRKFYKM